MQNETFRERQYIELIIGKISAKLKLGDPANWQQRDFENLSLLIEEKTGINLSVSTLKRLNKKQFSTVPQKHTLNALAQFLDYKDWYDFKTNNPHNIVNQPPEKKFRKPRIKSKFLIIPAAALVLILIVILVFNSQPVQSYEEVKFSSRKNVAEGVPNTVIFDYNISMYDFDSAFIQQSWDIRRRAEIRKNEKYSTSVYYYPGFHRAKLLINDQLVKEIPVYITTGDWLPLIQNESNNLIPIYVKEDCISNDRIYISPEIVKNYSIDLSENSHYTSFWFVNEQFSGNSDNFIFETRIKNALHEGGTTCQWSEISILGETGRHIIQFSSPGCIGDLYLKFGKQYVSGKNNDLSVFGANLNEWNDVKIEFKNRLAEIYLNGKSIFKTSYDESNGKIKGVFYTFGGSGTIDFAHLYDAENKLVFSDNFKQ